MAVSTRLRSAKELAQDDVVLAYFLEQATEFVELHELRGKGWNSAAADKVFEEQRKRADNTTPGGEMEFYRMMRKNGRELESTIGGLRISRTSTMQEPLRIVDFCTAPGGFLAEAVAVNRGAHAHAFTLPIEAGGHKIMFHHGKTIHVETIDITMPAEDMDVPINTIPQDHPDIGSFLPRALTPEQGPFDLAICDGQVLRTQTRASYREAREATRLINTQLALGLEHLRQGGKMVVLLHHLETWRSVRLLHQFNSFSTVKLFKPTGSHTARSSFYMVASDVDPLHDDAVKAVAGWKDIWQIATFGTDEEYQDAMSVEETSIHEVLAEFGEELAEWAKPIWKIQHDSLAKKPWAK